MTALHVDDAEAAHPERDAGGPVSAAVVRAAVRHRVGHPVEHLRRDDLARLTADLDDTTDSAHLQADAIPAGLRLRPPAGQTWMPPPSRSARGEPAAFGRSRSPPSPQN